jgi:hypothetical protein
VDGDRVNQPPSDTGLGRAGCGGTRTSGSEVRAGETDRPRRRHRAPVRPYALSWLSCWRRLQARWGSGLRAVLRLRAGGLHADLFQPAVVRP